MRNRFLLEHGREEEGKGADVGAPTVSQRKEGEGGSARAAGQFGPHGQLATKPSPAVFFFFFFLIFQSLLKSNFESK